MKIRPIRSNFEESLKDVAEIDTKIEFYIYMKKNYKRVIDAKLVTDGFHLFDPREGWNDDTYILFYDQVPLALSNKQICSLT